MSKKDLLYKSASVGTLGSGQAGSGAHNPADFFLQILQDPGSKPLVFKFKNFVKLCKEQIPDNPSERQRILRKFCERVEKICRGLPIFPELVQASARPPGSTPQQDMARCVDLLRDGVEKILLVKLYPLLFERLALAPVHAAFQRKLQLLSRFIEPKHLDLPPDVFFDHQKVQLATKQLAKLASYKAPKEKMICILNCCKVISSLMRDYASREPSPSAAASKRIGNPPAADELLSGLVLLIIKATPPSLKLTSQYIRLYRHPAHLQLGEPGYYYTLFESAVDFVDTCTASKFSISPAEYELNMADSRTSSSSSLTSSPPLTSSYLSPPSASSSTLILDFSLDESPLSRPPSTPPAQKQGRPQPSAASPLRPQSVPLHPAPLRTGHSSSSSSDLHPLPDLQPSSSSEGLSDIHYSFLTTSVGDLRVSQVASLLEEYKLIAQQNAQLRSLLRRQARSSDDTSDSLAPFF